MTARALTMSAVVVAVVGSVGAAALIGGWWWAAGLAGAAAAVAVPVARRSATVHAGACLSLVAGAAAVDGASGGLATVVVAVSWVASLELHAAAERTSVARPRVALDLRGAVVVAGTLNFAAAVVTVADLGPAPSAAAAIGAIVAAGIALGQGRAARIR